MTFVSRWIVPAFATLLVSLGASGCTDLTPCARGTEGCACKVDPDSDPCDTVPDGTAVCALGTCVVQRASDSSTACYDACLYRNDGTCDDGGNGSEHSDCNLGSDCGDCGPRENPCAGTASPVYCPQTPNNCWASNIDCLTVRRCNAVAPGMRGPFGCMAGQAIDCAAVLGPKCITTSTCQDMGRTPCVTSPTLSCVSPYIDCNSLVTCNGQPTACYDGETVTCPVSGSPSCTK